MCDRRDVETRLLDVATSDTVTELVVVLRGTVRRCRGAQRGLWRVQLGDGHRRIVSTESVIAITPVTAGASSLASGPFAESTADR
jgi:hypothetical protein